MRLILEVLRYYNMFSKNTHDWYPVNHHKDTVRGVFCEVWFMFLHFCNHCVVYHIDGLLQDCSISSALASKDIMLHHWPGTQFTNGLWGWENSFSLICIITIRSGQDFAHVTHDSSIVMACVQYYILYRSHVHIHKFWVVSSLSICEAGVISKVCIFFIYDCSS